MKKIGILFILLTALSFASYCQESEPDQNFHFIEVGSGAGYTRHIYGDFNAALSNSLSNHVANFIDFNMAFGKSSTLFQEISFKLGPYYRFNRYSYIALSSGISMIHNSIPVSENEYDNFNRYYYNTYSEPDYLFNIPIQAKLNVGVYKGCCIGLKGTLNKMIDKGVEDKGTVLLYLALGW